jgi:hypothetical protein
MTDIQGWYKTSYADKMRDLIPDNTYYAREAKPLKEDKQPGGEYKLSVTLTSEEGVTLAGPNAGAFALNAPISMSSDFASISGSQFLLRSALDYESIMNSKNKNAFIKASKGQVKNMVKSAFFYQEAEFMWGKSSIGTIASTGAASFVVTLAEWAPGLWLASKNRMLRIESVGGVLRGTCQISSVAISTRTITVDALPPGTAATDKIFFGSAGAAGANEQSGLHTIMTATGVFWGLSGTTYDVWQPEAAYSCSNAPLTFNKLMFALAGAGNKGLGDEISEIDVICNPNTWYGLGNDEAAMRNYDASYKPSMISKGAEQIEFNCPLGRVRVISHKMMKEGYAFIHPKASRCLQKVGSAPTPTFKIPGQELKGEDYLIVMQNNAGVEHRIYWNSSLFTEHRSKMRLISGIVNPTI